MNPMEKTTLEDTIKTDHCDHDWPIPLWQGDAHQIVLSPTEAQLRRKRLRRAQQVAAASVAFRIGR